MAQVAVGARWMLRDAQGLKEAEQVAHDGMVQHELRLSTLPEAHEQLHRLLRAPRLDRARLHHLVRLDPVYAFSVLAAARRLHPDQPAPRSLDDGLRMLGQQELIELLLEVPPFHSFDPWQRLGVDARALWRHAIATALLARSLQMRKKLNDPVLPDIYLSGLLCHTGWILRDRPGERSNLLRLLDAAAEEGGLTIERERALVGEDHAQLGGQLLARAGLAAPLVTAVRFHHEPERAGAVATSAGLVRLASALAPVQLPLEAPLEHPGSLVPHRLKLPAGPLSAQEMRERYRRRMEAVASLLPRLAPWLV